MHPVEGLGQAAVGHTEGQCQAPSDGLSTPGTARWPVLPCALLWPLRAPRKCRKPGPGPEPFCPSPLVPSAHPLLQSQAEAPMPHGALLSSGTARSLQRLYRSRGALFCPPVPCPGLPQGAGTAHPPLPFPRPEGPGGGVCPGLLSTPTLPRTGSVNVG